MEHKCGMLTSLELSVEAMGEPAPQLRWFLDNKPFVLFNAPPLRTYFFSVRLCVSLVLYMSVCAMYVCMCVCKRVCLYVLFAFSVHAFVRLFDGTNLLAVPLQRLDG